MILVTVGSTLFPFQRMTTLVEHLAHVLPKKETILYQYGHAAPHFLDTKIDAHPFLPHTELIRYMRRSDIIICHGGPATIYQALSFGKIPWVLPREQMYGEHLNNHQVDFARFMAKHALIHIIRPKTKMSDIYTAKQHIEPIHKQNAALIAHLHSITR